MISVVLYGRNDSYGYNLHKRAALSFNCIAELLDDEADEILFVDYNTPNDFPTFPEAIQDTLTDKARRHLRVLRARPSIHDRFRERTRLVALEPVSRNIAVRRANPANRWILSTNTDMIFVPQKASTLSAIVRDLPAGFYHAPRIELPETLWEGLDRAKPADVIATVRDWGSQLHLNEIVMGAPTIIYDGPGDFQLIEREVLCAIDGFNEDMILGWHVDSNVAKRLSLHYGSIGDLGQEVYGYHCDHTRQITPMHSPNRTENDIGQFVDRVTTPNLPAQRATWGCPDEDIEDIRLDRSGTNVYVSALREAVGEPLAKPYVASYTAEAFGKSVYAPRHQLSFLTDMFACAPKSMNIGWIGASNETLRLFAQVWTKLGFTGRILVDGSLGQWQSLGSLVEPAGIAAILTRADAFIFDFPTPTTPDDSDVIRALRKFFLKVVGAELARMRDKRPLRQIIAVNVINTPQERFVTECIAAGSTPFATRMRHGYVRSLGPDFQNWEELIETGAVALAWENWLPRMTIGRSGWRQGDVIVSEKRNPESDNVVYGPYCYLPAGRYIATFDIVCGMAPGDRSVGRVDACLGAKPLSERWFTVADVAAKPVNLPFEISEADDNFDTGLIELRVWSTGQLPFTIRSVKVRSHHGEFPADLLPSLVKRSSKSGGVLDLARRVKRRLGRIYRSGN